MDTTADEGLFAVQTFTLHPVLKGIGIAFVAAYVRGAFSYAVLFRDEAGGKPYGERFFSREVNGHVITKEMQAMRKNVLKGFWTAVEWCAFPNYSVSRKINVMRNPYVGLPVGENFVTLSLPDGIEYAGPKVVGNSRMGKQTRLFVQWNVDSRTIVRTMTVYGKDGGFRSQCTTDYYRLF